MKIKVLSFYSKILSFILILLGFSGCESNGATEYGTPTAKFIIKGKVVNKEEQKSVEGLKVAIGYLVDENEERRTIYVDSVQTNAKGEFNVNIIEFPKQQKFVIKYEDDKNQDAKFGLTTDTVRFEDPKFTNGSGGWYSGEATQDLGTIEIVPVKEDK